MTGALNKIKYPKTVKKILTTVIIGLLGLASSPHKSQAETLSLYTESFSVSGAPTSSSILGGRWGVWNGSSFSQAVTSAANAGYVDLGAPEMSVTLNQIDNSVYTAGTQLSLALYGNDGVADSQAINFSTAAGQSGFRFALFTDPSWIAPTFGNNANFVDFEFTANTTALGGSGYNFNSGSPQITMVPEPSTSALLALGGLALGGYALRRRCRA